MTNPMDAPVEQGPQGISDEEVAEIVRRYTLSDEFRREEEYEAHYAEHLFNATRELGEYCVEEAIDHIIFLDRSARPAWNTLSEYFNLAHPDRNKPGMHFMDPHLLIANRDLPKRARPNQTQPNILIFDCCTHTGGSIDGTKRFLEGLGYENIKTGVFTDSTDESTLPFTLNFAYTTHDNALRCKPFGVDDHLIIGQDIYVQNKSDKAANSERHARRTGQRALIRAQFEHFVSN